MKQAKIRSYFKNHLNVWWLRPESALCDAISSIEISKYKISLPSLDLGCGNGIFSFITAGGELSIDYDWFINIDTKGFWLGKDIYDYFKVNKLNKYIIKRAEYSFTYGLDIKTNLLKQAAALGLYQNIIRHDANSPLPFKEYEIKTAFSNIIYWLKDAERSLLGINKILTKNGIAILCIPSKKFYDYCITYQWKDRKSELLRLLNHGRSDSIYWTVSYEEFSKMAQNSGFEIVGYKSYLSPLILKIWDIGLRPLSPLLIKMANIMDQKERRAIKIEWMDTVIKFLLNLYEIEESSKEEGGFHLFVLRKK